MVHFRSVGSPENIIAKGFSNKQFAFKIDKLSLENTI